MISRRAFLQTIFLPIVATWEKTQGTIPDMTTLAEFADGGCVQAKANGTTGQILLIDATGNPNWASGNDIGVTPPTGFSSTELGDLLAEMTSAIGTTRKSRLFIADGNSITDDSPEIVTGHWRPWPYWVMSQTTQPVINTAVGSTDILECIKRAPVNVDKLYGLALQTWVIIWEGTNYLARSGDVATCYAQHVAYCRARKAAGATKVYIGTIISREPSVTYTIAQKNAFNDLLRTNWTNFCDGLLDFASIPQIGGDTSYADTTYFRDGIHLTDAGSKLVADYIIAQLGLT